MELETERCRKRRTEKRRTETDETEAKRGQGGEDTQKRTTTPTDRRGETTAKQTYCKECYPTTFSTK